jgi:ATP-binding cassette subfamily B protein
LKGPRPSRSRYQDFRRDYRQGRVDDGSDHGGAHAVGDGLHRVPEGKAVGDSLQGGPGARPSKRREYVREYLRWLWPHRFAVTIVFVLALVTASLQMIEPLFIRFIIDRVLLNTTLDAAARLTRLNTAGALYFVMIATNSLLGVLKDYRQRILNVRVMLTLRQELFHRMLHLPLPKLWDMKTGGILSRLTGDIDTTTGLMQMAIVSPGVSVIRLLIAIVVLLVINWRLALTALAIVPGVMILSFIFAKRVRPIYRSVRKDAEVIDGRVGETFSGIRVVRAFRRELRELREYMLGRHTVLRK